VQLGADTVVLVLDPGLVTDAPHHLGGVRHRRGQHEADGAAKVQRGGPQRPGARQHGRLAGLAHQHVGATHVVQRSVESSRDRLLQQSLAQPDAQLPRGHAADESRLLGRGAREEPGHDLHAGLGARRVAHGAKGGADIGHAQPRRRAGSACQQVGRGIAEVGMTQVCVVERGGVGRAHRGERLALLHPAEPQPVRRARQRPPGEEGGRDRQLRGREVAQVRGQRVALAQLRGGGCDLARHAGELGEGAAGHRTGV
jgi:hypothetical protein